MGRPREIPPFPGAESEERRIVQYWLMLALYELCEANNLTTQEIADLIGGSKEKIQSWSFQNAAFRLPTLPDCVKLAGLKNLQASGNHGRPFNYVWLFEGKANTELEVRLMYRVKQLEEQLSKMEHEKA